MQRIFEENCGLDRSQLVLVGVSGGPDSFTLLDMLWNSGYKIAAAHFNHNLRPESSDDARAVQAAAQKYGVDFFLGKGDVKAKSQSEKLSIEEAARKARYRFLFDTANAINAQAVAVGHTADDQIETILMHLLRGSGLAGLKGMPWQGYLPEFDAKMRLVRPLLGMWREEITAYCEEHQLHPVIDASNFDTTYYRNKLRLELVPTLKEYNPQIKEILWRMGQTLEGDQKIIGSALADAEKLVNLETESGFARLNLEQFITMPGGIQRNLMRRMIGLLRSNQRDIDFDTVERALAFANHPSQSGEMELALGLNVIASRDQLYMIEKNKELTDPSWPRLENEEYSLPIPGKLELGRQWVLTAEICERPETPSISLNSSDEMIVLLDRKKLGDALVIRKHQAGDKFKPFGFQGHSIKVSDIWVNIKLPRWARKYWPLICHQDQIAWLPGYRPGIEFVVDETTRQVVRLSLIQMI